MQVAFVCLVVLASGKLHCKPDSKHCWEAAPGQAESPLSSRRAGTLSLSRSTAFPTVQVSCKHRETPAACSNIPMH